MDTHTDSARSSMGFRSVAELRELDDVLVLDPDSTLIGRDVVVGAGTVVYPGVVLEATDGGTISVGAGVFLGPGGVTVIAERGTVVSIGDGARIRAGAWIEGPATIGAGAQVLGTVQARDVVLAGGGSFREPDPDRRGAVVKGTGRLHGSRIGIGEVIELGRAAHAVERQRAHHAGSPGPGVA